MCARLHVIEAFLQVMLEGTFRAAARLAALRVSAAGCLVSAIGQG